MKNNKILLIEDNDIDVHIARSLLNSINDEIKIDRCKNGQEALDFLNDDDLLNPDLILLDINMPVMNGKEFLKERANLSSIIHEIPVIIVTSSAITAEKKECMQLGANDYIEKPVSMEVFKEKLGLFKLDI